ncbi:JmjC domain-containing protein [Rubrivivax albus]|uniref:Cupin domain-containing protein n=1 Tax=Rubrivivax albus TaxID=2499835 RepID=A0A3S3SBY9_9BURK|nr:cupin domain-containing protein [Rubrivivax albus]RVT51034.1 cupin domain-containing protein [Rubrivivax albus]
MDIQAPTALLGGLSPAQFMRRHWQKQPLLVRQAWPGVTPPLSRPALFALAAQDGIESRLVRRMGQTWSLRRGPLPRRALPPLQQPGWTLLVQGLDLHTPAAHAMLAPFAFVPHARLDDLMVSWASDGGGVGPHVDAYDVFLIQLHGRRRWRVAPPGDRTFVDGLPLRILQHFAPTQEWVLEPGDMLYLPPMWGHDGTAVGGDCMTASVGFRTPHRRELARELLLRLADAVADADGPDPIYADRGQAAVADPGRIPPGYPAFASNALAAAFGGANALPRALGEVLSEPKPGVWFDPPARTPAGHGALRLDARTRMLYDDRHVFVNGESWRAAGRDARLLRQLADARRLSAADRARLSGEAAAIVDDWLDDGWLHEEDGG